MFSFCPCDFFGSKVQDWGVFQNQTSISDIWIVRNFGLKRSMSMQLTMIIFRWIWRYLKFNFRILWNCPRIIFPIKLAKKIAGDSPMLGWSNPDVSPWWLNPQQLSGQIPIEVTISSSNHVFTIKKSGFLTPKSSMAFLSKSIPSRPPDSNCDATATEQSASRPSPSFPPSTWGGTNHNWEVFLSAVSSYQLSYLGSGFTGKISLWLWLT